MTNKLVIARPITLAANYRKIGEDLVLKHFFLHLYKKCIRSWLKNNQIFCAGACNVPL